jgi:hypothetical protein
MAVPSTRLARRIAADFGSSAGQVLKHLSGVPEALPLAENLDAERVQAALVLPAGGSFAAFAALLRMAMTDWRDALVAADLANADWPAKLEGELGPASE